MPGAGAGVGTATKMLSQRHPLVLEVLNPAQILCQLGSRGGEDMASAGQRLRSLGHAGKRHPLL